MIEQIRNLVICCDGTGNVWTAGSEITNIVKIVRRVVRDEGQLVYYDPGVGTASENVEESATLRNRLRRLAGLAWGDGVWHNVAEAYLWLMHRYQPGDRIFLFGFSRGAFTVRALSGLLDLFGLLHTDHESMVPSLITVYRSPHDHDEAIVRRKMQALELRRYFGTDPPTDAEPESFPIHFIGVFDTVESVGLSELVFGATAQSDNRVKPGVKYVRHALAIDEARWAYESRQYIGPNNIPVDAGPPRLVQAWFPGAHCDVGGGYAEHGLSDLVLWWMLEETQGIPEGLRLSPNWKDDLAPNPWGPLHSESIAMPLWTVIGQLRRSYFPRLAKDQTLRACIARELKHLRGDSEPCPDAVLVSEGAFDRCASYGDRYVPMRPDVEITMLGYSPALRHKLVADHCSGGEVKASSQQRHDVVSDWWRKGQAVHRLVILLGIFGLWLEARHFRDQFQLFEMQLTGWNSLSAQLVTWAGHDLGTLLWSDSVFALGYGGALAYVITYCLHRAGNPRPYGMLCCYTFAALVLGDLFENCFTGLAVNLRESTTVFGIPASWVAEICGILVGLCCVGKLLGLLLTTLTVSAALSIRRSEPRFAFCAQGATRVTLCDNAPPPTASIKNGNGGPVPSP